MLKTIKFLCREGKYLVKKDTRRFFFILFKYRFNFKLQISKSKLFNLYFNAPHIPSFIAQIIEIFIDKVYMFYTKTESPVIIDCGANIGVGCLFFKKTYPNAKIYAIEPNKDIAKYLYTNIKVNEANNVKIIESAAWIDTNGINLSQETNDSSSIYGETNVVNVTSIRLRDLINSFDFVDFLKIDIEGAEYEVLKDCIDVLHKVENIFLEYHSFRKMPQKLDEILNILSSANYRYYLQTMNSIPQPLYRHHDNGEIMDLQINISGIKRK